MLHGQLDFLMEQFACIGITPSSILMLQHACASFTGP